MSTTALSETTGQDVGPLEDMGPIDSIVIEFPHRRLPGEGLPILVDLVDRRIIRVLDLAFVRKELDGSVHRSGGPRTADGGLRRSVIGAARRRDLQAAA
jgi:hypothetical protein